MCPACPRRVHVKSERRGQDQTAAAGPAGQHVRAQTQKQENICWTQRTKSHALTQWRPFSGAECAPGGSKEGARAAKPLRPVRVPVPERWKTGSAGEAGIGPEARQKKPPLALSPTGSPWMGNVADCFGSVCSPSQMAGYHKQTDKVGLKRLEAVPK